MAIQELKLPVQHEHAAVALFQGHDAMVDAVRRLRAMGYASEQISVLAKDEAALKQALEEIGAQDGRETDSPSMLADGMEPKGIDEAAGMLIGGGVGLILGLSAIALPGLGAFLLAAGPVAVALHGLTFAAGGLGMGALIGAIMDERVTEEIREKYEQAIDAGHWLVVAHGEEADSARARQAMMQAGASRVDTY